MPPTTVVHYRTAIYCYKYRTHHMYFETLRQTTCIYTCRTTLPHCVRITLLFELW